MTLTSWQGHTIDVDAPAQTDGSGASWVFQSWSDGGAAAHSFATPATATTYTATFAQSAAPVRPGGGVSGWMRARVRRVADSSGRGNGGTVSGAVWSASGRFGSALSFDGVNDWVTVPDSASLDLSSGMTVEAWVRPSRLGGWRTVVVKERPGGVVYGLYGGSGWWAAVGSGGHRWGAECGWVGGVAVECVVASGGDVRWVGGASVRERCAGGLVAVLGVDGGVDGVVAAGRERRLGEWFAGLIDEVRVYNRALSASEIQQDMQRPVAGTAPPPPPPTDTTPPVAPSALTSSVSIGTVTLTWPAATDAVGVTRYNVHRSTTAGFTPAAANRIGQPTGTATPTRASPPAPTTTA